ncbi:MAG: hypothetical protein Q9220_002667 [cf. Caloplaca sp. 1 TL-2023]
MCITGSSARALVEGEYHSASTIGAVVPGLVPKAIGWGRYGIGESEVHFFLGDFHDMDLSTRPDPQTLMSRIAELHQKGTSPKGMFGFPVPVVLGNFQRTVNWETSWAKCFTHQLEDVIRYDNSEGRDIKPTLIHGDLWENNVGIDKETGESVLFDPGSTYAHNEMEFGTWRCTWARYFNSPIYMQLCQRQIKPSEPVDE